MWPEENFYSSILKEYEHIIPINFNTALYLSLYPDLVAFGIKTENQAKQHYLLFGKNENRICFIPEDFDPSEYKDLNPDLKHLSTHDLFIHYINNGYYEHRIFNTKKIEKVFDTNFYQQYYRTKSGIEEYLDHGIKEGRYYHPSIVDNDFDYGFYISYYNHFHDSKNFKSVWDQFDAIDHYLNNPEYKPNNIISYSDINIDINDGICLYVGHINDHKDIDYTIESLVHILNFFKQNIVELSFSNISVKKSFIQKYKNISNKNNVIFLIDKINIGYDFGKYNDIYKKHIDTIKQYSYVCHINNSIVIYNNKILHDFIGKFAGSGCDLYGLTDCYIRNSLINRNLYHIQSYCFVVPNQYIDTLYRYIASQNKTLLNNNKNEIVKDLEIGLSAHFIKNDIKIGSYSTLTDNKEFLWHNIMNFDPSLDLAYLQYNDLSITKRQCLKHDNIPLSSLKLKQNSILSDNKNENLIKIGNIKNQTSIDLTSYKIALCCHIYDEYFYPEISILLDKLKKSLLNIDYYITTNTENTIIENGIVVPNKGADLGPFILSSLQTIPKDTDFFIKIHAKTHHGFRKYTISEIINNIYYNLVKLIQDDSIYALGSKRYILMMDKFNTSTINDFYSRYNILNVDESKIKFISGTMMVGKYKKYLDICDNIGLCFDTEYKLMENGYKKNTTPTHTHAWERILSGILPYIGNMTVSGI